MSDEQSVGELLDPAFSLAINGLNTSLDNNGFLMKAVVTLRSIEVNDIREISRDYAIKKVFGPMDTGLQKSDSISNNLISQESAGSEDGTTNEADAKAMQEIITVKYHQESKQLAYLNVLVNNASSFASSDTFLDLSNVAMANFFAVRVYIIDV